MEQLGLDRWNHISSGERERLAQTLANNLPYGFALREIRAYTLGGQTHYVAEFTFEDANFVLIPGGPVALGLDAEWPWEPTPNELESWQYSAQEYDIQHTLHEHIVSVTLRSRTVEFHPFLIETRAQEFGWEDVPMDNPRVQAILSESFPNGNRPYQAEESDQDSWLRVRRDQAGRTSAERSHPVTHAELSTALAAAGFRFPTSDEWEYVCGAGTRTLFRWGDHAPCDRYPTHISVAEATWRREWVLSMGKLEYPSEGFKPDWELHRDPNAFGVLIASDPYKCELVKEPDMIRGGDGGVTSCGGAGFFLGWLTLATAYFDPQVCRRDPNEPIWVGYTFGRRVLPLE